MTAEREALERELRAHVAGMQCAIDNCGISQKEWDAATKYAMDNIGEWKRLLSEYAANLSRAAEPVHQYVRKYPIGSDHWIDCTEKEFNKCLPHLRRILYTHPPEPARDANRWRQVWINERAYRYRRASGMNTEQARLKAEADANHIDAAMAQESGE